MVNEALTPGFDDWRRRYGYGGGYAGSTQQKRPRTGPVRVEVLWTEEMVRPRGLEPPRLSSLAPQASASTNSAMAAIGDPDRSPGEAERVTDRVRRHKPVQPLRKRRRGLP